jgi:hypothetical protein
MTNLPQPLRWYTDSAETQARLYLSSLFFFLLKQTVHPGADLHGQLHMGLAHMRALVIGGLSLAGLGQHLSLGLGLSAAAAERCLLGRHHWVTP